MSHGRVQTRAGDRAGGKATLAAASNSHEGERPPEDGGRTARAARWKHVLSGGNVLLSLFFVVLGLALLWQTFGVNYRSNPGDPVGPFSWSRGVLAALILAAAVDVVLTVRSRLRDVRKSEGPASDDGDHRHEPGAESSPSVPTGDSGSTSVGAANRESGSGSDPVGDVYPAREPPAASEAPDAEESSGVVPARNWRLLVLGTVLVIAFGYGTSVIGFLPATFVFLLLFMWLGGYRNVAGVVLIAAVATFGITYMFSKVVYLSLPLGRGVLVGWNATLFHWLGLY